MAWPETEFRKLDNPNSCPGAYDLHLYCDHANPDHEFREFPKEISGLQTEKEAKAFARKVGWKFHSDGTATCPKCVKRLTSHKGP